MNRLILLLGLVAAADGHPAVAAPPPLTAADAARVLAVVRPSAGEDAFAEIPWRTSLWDAREAAAKAGKPILLWEMDGHPLGCG